MMSGMKELLKESLLMLALAAGLLLASMWIHKSICQSCYPELSEVQSERTVSD